MRYLLFFLFIFVTHISLAQYPPQCSGEINNFNACGFVPELGGGMLATGFASCQQAGAYVVFDQACPSDSLGKGSNGYKCFSQCSCPEGQTLNQNTPTGESTCTPDEGSEGSSSSSSQS